MAVLTLTLHVSLVWAERTIFMSTCNLSFMFPHVAEGLLQDRTMNLEIKVNPSTGRVSISLQSPDMEEPWHIESLFENQIARWSPLESQESKEITQSCISCTIELILVTINTRWHVNDNSGCAQVNLHAKHTLIRAQCKQAHSQSGHVASKMGRYPTAMASAFDK